MKCNEKYSWLRTGHFYYNMALLKKKRKPPHLSQGIASTLSVGV